VVFTGTRGLYGHPWSLRAPVVFTGTRGLYGHPWSLRAPVVFTGDLRVNLLIFSLSILPILSIHVPYCFLFSPVFSSAFICVICG